MQIVGYETAAGDAESAALVLADDGELSHTRLPPGTELSYSLGDRHCAGVVSETGHEACVAPDAPYCVDHIDRWACARCTGDCNLPLENCRAEHVVYLAAFAPETVKVGVTKSWRLETRLREQGADRGALLRTVKNGRIAREIEAEIAADLGDRVRVPAKVRGLDATVDEAFWQELLGEFETVETYAFEYGLDLADRPMTETMAAGTVRGTKGRILVLDRGGSSYAVDMRDLVGFEVERGEAERELQSSLGAFE